MNPSFELSLIILDKFNQFLTGISLNSLNFDNILKTFFQKSKWFDVNKNT